VNFSRCKPGFVVSSVVHGGLLLATLAMVSDARKFEDAHESVPVEIVTDQQLNQIMKGEKTAKEVKATPRVDQVAPTHAQRPQPPIAEAKRDIPAPPPSLKRIAEPTEDDTPEPPKEAPTPPKRVAALPPPPAPEPAQETPAPPVKPQAKAAPPKPEKVEPEEAEVVKPKPPVRPKLEKSEQETPTPPKPEKPAPKKAEPRLKTDEVAKLLAQKKREDKNAKDDASDDADDKPEKSAKSSRPKSGDETAPKSKFNAANIASILSREAPQRRASTGAEATRVASLGAPTASAPKLSPSLQAKIDGYTIDHYRRCWAAALSMNAIDYVPRVEFRLTRTGELEGAPRLLNPSAHPVERSRGEQALAAVRRCSPMPIPAEFTPYYDYWRVTELDMKEDM
jgi:hypothetical protein